MAGGFLSNYYLYQAAATSTFFQAVYFVYYEERIGLGLPAILLLQSYNTGLRALLDMPFGALADRTSRRGCLVAGTAIVLVGAALLLLWPTPASAVVAETAFAMASALRSGADSALLYDTLHAAGTIEQYPRAESRAQAIAALGSGTSAILGGVMAGVDLRLPFAASIVTAAAGAAIAARLGDPPHAERSSALLRDAADLVRRTPAVRWVLALAVVAVTSSHVYFFLQQPYLRAAGVPLALFGVVFAATKAVTALVAAWAHRVDDRLGARATAALVATVPACGLGAMAAVAGPAGAAFILTRGVLDGLWMPLVNVYMNRLVSSRLRATMLSLQSVVSRLALAAVLAILGVVSARAGLAATLGGAAGVVVVAGIGLVLWAPRNPR